MAAMIMKNEKWKMKNWTTNSTKSNQQKDIRAQQWQYTDAQALYDDRWYRIPDTIEEITKLPGVGIKTAKVVLYILYGQRRVAVDTHVHRVMNRLGIVTTNTPEQTSVLLETIIPDERKDVAHRVIIYFGRYWCTAKKPNCVACKLKDVCPRYQQHKKKL
jgi:endonuclease III